jgi:hypothetical protein
MRPDSHLPGTGHDAPGEAGGLVTSPLPVTDPPRPGQKVRWRDPRHARAIGWLDAHGPGPFEVVGLVDKSHQGLPPAVVVRTGLGEREINAVWLAAEGGEAARQGPLRPGENYTAETLLALED